jgi:hypothetical protein
VVKKGSLQGEDKDAEGQQTVTRRNSSVEVDSLKLLCQDSLGLLRSWDGRVEGANSPLCKTRQCGLARTRENEVARQE